MIHPVRFSITPGFFALVLWFTLASGWRPLAVICGAAAVHEAGHWLALRVCGARVTEFHLGILGAVLSTDSIRLSYGRELFCVLAGPAANLAAAYLSRAAGNFYPELAGVNLILCAFNLIPVRTLDGGRAVELSAAWAFGPEAAERVTRAASVTASAALACGIGFLIFRSGGSLWLLPAMAGMICSCAREIYQYKI